MPLLPVDTLTYYLPFPDGVLHYVCAECDAICCRGHGFAGSVAGEMARLLVVYPALEGAVTGRHGDVIALQNPVPGCYFLQDDNRCGVEVTHGRALKPGLCKLFPFNNFARLGEDIVVIAPHFLCPLRVVLPRADHVAGKHHDVIQAAKESFLLDRGDFSANVAMLSLASNQTAHDTLQQETVFRDACSEGLHATRFYDVLARSTTNPDALQRFLARAALVCGVAPAAPHGRDDLDDILLVVAPSWRLKMLPLGQERMLRVLALAEVLIRRLAPLSLRAMTPQQVEQSYTAMFPACRLLSLDESPMIAPNAPRTVPPFGTADVTFTAYHVLRAAEKNVLAAFEEAFSQGTPTHDRMAILIELGRQYADPTASTAPNSTASNSTASNSTTAAG